MRKNNSKERKIEKNKKSHESLDKFYSDEQKHREKIEKIEDEIFEHLKNHTKKVLKK